MRLCLILAGLLLALSAPARAQQAVSVEFTDGQVTLRAQNAPVRAILAEWARRGGATIVNGERVAGPPLTLELTGVPERQALDIVLRSVAGYMLAPRRAGSAGPSMFDRILILPTSAAPRPAPPAAAAVRAPRPLGPAVRLPQARPVPVAPVDDSDLEPDDPNVEEDVLPPRPVPPRIIRPAIPQGGEREPTVVTDRSEEPDQDMPVAAPTPGNPFGVPIGSGRPGVITPSPQQPDQKQR